MKRMDWLFIAALTGTTAQAQTSIGNRLGVGLFNQVLKGDQDFEDLWAEDQVKLLAPAISLPVEIGLSKHFALQPELGFVQRGNRYEDDYGTSTFQVNSVEFSLLAKGFIDVGKWKPYVFAGPSINRCLSVRSYFEPSVSSIPGSSELVMTADDYPLEITQISATAGLGAAFRIGVPWLFVDYRHFWGLTPMMRIDFVDVNMNVLKDGRLYDRGNIFSIGIMIPLSRGAWQSPGTEREPPADPQT